MIVTRKNKMPWSYMKQTSFHATTLQRLESSKNEKLAPDRLQ